MRLISAEPYVEAVMWGRLARASNDSGREGVAAAQREVDVRGEELAAYRDNPRWLATLGADRFDAGLRVRTAREEQALIALAAARGAAAALPPSIDDLRRDWPTMGLQASAR